MEIKIIRAFRKDTRFIQRINLKIIKV